ncbi:MAG: hypothetical protein Q9179_005790 [Wetmoreana sp. 5 TL-2023]
MLSLIKAIRTIGAAVISIGGIYTYSSFNEHRPLKALQGYANLSYQLTLTAPKIIIPKVVPHASVFESRRGEQSPVINATLPRVPPEPLGACWYLPISEQGANSTCPLDTFDSPESLWGQISAEEKAESERQLERFWAHFGDALAESEMAGRLNKLRALRKDIRDQIVFLTPCTVTTVEDTLWDLEWQPLAAELTDVFFLGDAQTRRLTALKWAVKELAENLDSANSQYAALKETFTIAVSEADTLGQARDELEIQKSDLAAQIQNLTAQKEDLVARIEDLTARNLHLLASNRDLIAQNQDLATQSSNLTAENLDITAQKQNLTAHTQDLSIKLNAANANCSRVKQELDDYAARYRRALQSSDEVRTQRDEALQQLRSAKEDNDALKSQAEASKMRGEAQRKAMEGCLEETEHLKAANKKLETEQRRHREESETFRSREAAKEEANAKIRAENERLQSENTRVVKELQASRSQSRGSKSDKGSKNDQDQILAAKDNVEAENTTLKASLALVEQRVGALEDQVKEAGEQKADAQLSQKRLQAELDSQKAFISQMKEKHEGELFAFEVQANERWENETQALHDEKRAQLKEQEEFFNGVIAVCEAKVKALEEAKSLLVPSLTTHFDPHVAVPIAASTECNCQRSQALQDKYTSSVITYQEQLQALRESIHQKDNELARFGAGPRSRVPVNPNAAPTQGTQPGTMVPHHPRPPMQPRGYPFGARQGVQPPSGIADGSRVLDPSAPIFSPAPSTSNTTNAALQQQPCGLTSPLSLPKILPEQTQSRACNDDEEASHQAPKVRLPLAVSVVSTVGSGNSAQQPNGTSTVVPSYLPTGMTTANGGSQFRNGPIPIIANHIGGPAAHSRRSRNGGNNFTDGNTRQQARLAPSSANASSTPAPHDGPISQEGHKDRSRRSNGRKVAGDGTGENIPTPAAQGQSTSVRSGDPKARRPSASKGDTAGCKDSQKADSGGRTSVPRFGRMGKHKIDREDRVKMESD